MITTLLSELGFSALMLISVVCTLLITFIAIKIFKKSLPKDQGREFAVNGALSEGKPRGAGIILITCLTLCSALFVPLNVELIIYLVLIYAAMLTGFLDDCAKNPWGPLKKGLLDFVIALGIVINYIYFNGTKISILKMEFNMPVIAFAILGLILVWASINVTNCSDGVDGLCGSLFFVSLFGLSTLINTSFDLPVKSIGWFGICGIMLCVTGVYLWFNCSPSKLLMGDAGSRSMGVILAITAMKTGHPLMFIPLCIMLIIDGGLSLLKLSCRRFLGMKKFMENIRTPIHDHMRKNKSWSDTQVVIRFVLIQIAVFAVVKYTMALM